WHENGYNGSQLQDVVFAVQAIISSNLLEEYGQTIRKAHSFIKKSYILEDCLDDLNYWYCHISKGAWPFSTKDHGWPISDCTSEELKAALLLSKLHQRLLVSQSKQRGYMMLLISCSHCRITIVALQHMNSHDHIDGWHLFELHHVNNKIINPAETFGDILCGMYISLSASIGISLKIISHASPRRNKL
ncbi:hypothetical protein S83_069975, partial [Arachis hypogaea]